MSEPTQEQIKPFVIASHGDLPTVKKMLAGNPDLLNTVYVEWNETPLGAASHVGNREIALYLLSKGATMTICTAAMLGEVPVVEKILTSAPEEANAQGAHGIPLLFHAGLGGSVKILDRIKQHGGSTEHATAGLHAAVMRGHTDAAVWFLENGADVNQPNQQGQTPLALAREKGNPALAVRLESMGAVE